MVYLITFLVFLAVIALMAIGVLMKRKSIKGSCGGLVTLGIERECQCEDVCDEHRQLYQIQEPTKSC